MHKLHIICLKGLLVETSRVSKDGASEDDGVGQLGVITAQHPLPKYNK